MTIKIIDSLFGRQEVWSLILFNFFFFLFNFFDAFQEVVGLNKLDNAHSAVDEFRYLQ